MVGGEASSDSNIHNRQRDIHGEISDQSIILFWRAGGSLEAATAFC